MKKPETLNTISVGETREKYRKNQAGLENIVLLVMTGCFEECKQVSSESIMNLYVANLVIQQEYIREREKANWGWGKEVVDFSKHTDCIL